MLVRLEQPENAQTPILVTVFGIVILARLEQFPNAERSILVTLFGIVMLVRLEQPENAELPILVTVQPSNVEGIVTSPLIDVLMSVIVASLFETV